MIWVSLILILTALDQLSKLYFFNNQMLYKGYEVIDNFFYITYLENRGAAFGILQNFRWVFIILTVVTVVVLIAYFVKNNNTVLRLSLALLISGAIGNFIDRLFRGFVVDFLDFFPFGYNFPIFNVADICVTVGVFILGIYILFIYKEPNKQIEFRGEK